MIKIKRCCCYKRCAENDISYNEMINLLNKYSAILLDVRSNQEFKEGHFDGAINVPLCDIKKKIQKKISNKNKYIIAYCTSGIRSKKAQKILNSIGYKNVYNLVSGYN